MEEIKLLIEELRETEEEKNRSLAMLQTAIDEALEEMLDVLLTLFEALKRTDLSVRSYKGNSFPLGDGIVVYAKGLEEKIILNSQRQLIHCKVVNELLEKNEIAPDILIHQIGTEKVYQHLKDLLKERIHTNKVDINHFKNQAGKVSRRSKELDEQLQ